MPKINEQVSSNGPAISRAVPALAMIEANTPALATAFAGSYPEPFRGAGQSGTPGSIYNPYKSRLYLQNNVNVASSVTSSVVPFDTTDYDTSRNWDATNHRWVVPATGWYQIQAKANINTTGNVLAWFQLTIFAVLLDLDFITGVYFSQTNTIAGTGAAGSVLQGGYDAVVADDFYAKQGQFMMAKVTQVNDAGATLPLSGGGVRGQYTYMSLHHLSQ